MLNKYTVGNHAVIGRKRQKLLYNTVSGLYLPPPQAVINSLIP